MNNLLLVDDERSLLSSLTRILRNQPYHCYTASSAQDALDIIKKFSIDVIVSDYNMPGMNGIELLQQVRQNHPEIIRLMLTGQLDVNLASQAINEGIIYKFLLKPCSVEYFIDQIQQAFAFQKSLKHKLHQQTILSTVFDAVVITDADGEIIESNPAYDLILNEPRDKSIGLNFFELLSRANDEETITLMHDGLADKGFWVGEVKLIDNLEQNKTLWLSSAIIRKSNGEIINYVYSLLDT